MSDIFNVAIQRREVVLPSIISAQCLLLSEQLETVSKMNVLLLISSTFTAALVFYNFLFKNTHIHRYSIYFSWLQGHMYMYIVYNLLTSAISLS